MDDLFRMSVAVVRCRNLQSVDNLGSSDPFVIVTIPTVEGTSRAYLKTKVRKRNINPIFNQVFRLSGIRTSDMVVLTVMDWDRFSDSTFLGQAQIPLKFLVDKGRKEITVRLGSLKSVPQDEFGKVRSCFKKPEKVKKAQSLDDSGGLGSITVVISRLTGKLDANGNWPDDGSMSDFAGSPKSESLRSLDCTSSAPRAERSASGSTSLNLDSQQHSLRSGRTDSGSGVMAPEGDGDIDGEYSESFINRTSFGLDSEMEPDATVLDDDDDDDDDDDSGQLIAQFSADLAVFFLPLPEGVLEEEDVSNGTLNAAAQRSVNDKVLVTVTAVSEDNESDDAKATETRIRCHVTVVDAATLRVSFRPLGSGEYLATCSVPTQDESITASVFVPPGVTYAPRCTLLEQPDCVAQNAEGLLVIRARDVDAAPVRAGGGGMFVVVAKPLASEGAGKEFRSTDLGDGKYSVRYQCDAEAGSVLMVSIAHDGSQIEGSPFKIPVVQSASVTETVLEVCGLQHLLCRDEAEFVIRTMDAGSRRLWRCGDLFEAWVEVQGQGTIIDNSNSNGRSLIKVAMENQRDGSYVGRFTASKDGRAALIVLCNGKPIRASPFLFQIHPRHPGPENKVTASVDADSDCATFRLPSSLFPSLQQQHLSDTSLCSPASPGSSQGEDRPKHGWLAKRGDSNRSLMSAASARSSGSDFSRVSGASGGVIPQGVGPGKLDVRVVTPNGAVCTATLTLTADGSEVDVSFPSAGRGVYCVTFLHNGSEIPPSPLRVIIDEAAHGPSCYADGAGVKVCMIGKEGVFRVVACDAAGRQLLRGGDRFECRVVGHGQTIFGRVTDIGDGTYDVRYPSPHTAGNYSLLLQLEECHIKTSPAWLRVVPGPKASCCVASGPDRKSARVGEVCAFTISLRDSHGHPVPTGGCDTQASILTGRKEQRATVTDLNNGDYEVRFVPSEEGTLQVKVLVEGDPVEGSPFVVDVQRNTCLLQAAVRGSTACFRPRPYPAVYSADVSEGGLAVSVVDPSGSSLNGDIMWNISPTSTPSTAGRLGAPYMEGLGGFAELGSSDGAEGVPFSIGFVPRSCGVHSVNIKTKDGELLAGPYAVVVHPGDVLPSHCTTDCAGLRRLRRCTKSQVELRLRDVDWDVVDLQKQLLMAQRLPGLAMQKHRVEAFLSLPSEKKGSSQLIDEDASGRVRCSVQTISASCYHVSYQAPNKAGRCFLHVLVDGLPVCNSPFPIDVTPGIDAKTVKAEGSGVRRAYKDVSTSFILLQPLATADTQEPQGANAKAPVARKRGSLEALARTKSSTSLPDSGWMSLDWLDDQGDSLTPEEVSVKVVGPTGAVWDVELTPVPDGSLRVSYMPLESGTAYIHVSVLGTPIPGSPLRCTVESPSKAYISGSSAYVSTSALDQRRRALGISEIKSLTVHVVAPKGNACGGQVHCTHTVTTTKARKGSAHPLLVSFPMCGPGLYQVSVSLDNAPLYGCPLCVLVPDENPSRGVRTNSAGEPTTPRSSSPPVSLTTSTSTSTHPPSAATNASGGPEAAPLPRALSHSQTATISASMTPCGGVPLLPSAADPTTVAAAASTKPLSGPTSPGSTRAGEGRAAFPPVMLPQPVLPARSISPDPLRQHTLSPATDTSPASNGAPPMHALHSAGMHHVASEQSSKSSSYGSSKSSHRSLSPQHISPEPARILPDRHIGSVSSNETLSRIDRPCDKHPPTWGPGSSLPGSLPSSHPPSTVSSAEKPVVWGLSTTALPLVSPRGVGVAGGGSSGSGGSGTPLPPGYAQVDDSAFRTSSPQPSMRSVGESVRSDSSSPAPPALRRKGSIARVQDLDADVELRQFFRALGLEMYADAFEREAITMDELVTMDESELQQVCGVQTFGHRRRIRRAAEEFAKNNAMLLR
eukprot:Rmarinus@m.18894